jgi:nicotinamide riboside kinase
VTVTGPESTGKTTLAARLAGQFDTAWSAEASRRYLERRLAAGVAPRDALGPAHVGPIAVAQVDLEEAAAHEAAAKGRPLVVRDTDLVSTVVYARHYYGACPAWIERAARLRRAALYLLCDVDVPWIPDAARDRPHDREALHAAFVTTLAALGCEVARIDGDWAARERRAAAALGTLRDR